MNRFEEKWISHMNEAKDLEHLHRIHDTVCLKKCKAFRDCSRCAIEQHYQFLKEGFLVMKEIELHIKTRGARIERKGDGFVIYVPYTRHGAFSKKAR